MPQHGALPGRLVYQDDGESRRRIAGDDVRQIDFATLELGPNQPAIVVVAERSEVSGTKTEAAARGEHARDLSAGGIEG